MRVRSLAAVGVLSLVLVACGGRPIVYGAYRAVVNPGDQVVYGVPSWNNDYYVDMTDAAATEVLIDLEADETYVRLEVSDNGCGFDAGSENASGLGLLHMRERASLVGGIFSMRAKAGEGVRLSIHAPIRREEEAIHE